MFTGREILEVERWIEPHLVDVDVHLDLHRFLIVSKAINPAVLTHLEVVRDFIDGSDCLNPELYRNLHSVIF